MLLGRGAAREGGQHRARTEVYPIVIGDLGCMASLPDVLHSCHSDDVPQLLLDMQTAVLLKSVRVLRRFMRGPPIVRTARRFSRGRKRQSTRAELRQRIGRVRGGIFH